MKSKTKVKTHDKKGNLRVINRKSNEIVMDDSHVIAVGTTDILQKDVVDIVYSKTRFSFDMIQQAENYFKAIHGDLFDKDRLEVMVASENAPIIFIYSGLRDIKNHVFVIAPRNKEIDD